MWIAAALAIAVLTPSAQVPAETPANSLLATEAPADARLDAAAQDVGVCQGRPAAPGQTLHGPILHIPNESQLCIAAGYDPSEWVPVSLTAPAPSRGALMGAAFGQNATCTIQPDGHARCDVAGKPLDAKLRRMPLRISNTWR